ncbi:MAG TPA: carbohydrate kinase family protein [Rectinemataceae bacterium]|nr:carbohydrate kinase family protein [Rectinemataceae bacterium]
MSVRIAGTGCCLMDIIYPDVDFESPGFARLRSLNEGDGGVHPGRLVFASDLEGLLAQRAGQADAGASGAWAWGAGSAALSEALGELTRGRAAAARNIGGPSIVSLIHAAQMLGGRDVAVEYHGARGDDEIGRSLVTLLAKTPVDCTALKAVPGRSPSTWVLSDPRWDGGKGERCFVNDLGVAERFGPEGLEPRFYTADIAAFGGTALTPRIHDALPELLAAARSAGALTFVNTVFDFRNEVRNPGARWPLGPAGAARAAGANPDDSASAYELCDLLVMDQEEALRLSGCRELAAAMDFFEGSGVGAWAITRGGASVLAWASGSASGRRSGRRFRDLGRIELPVSSRALDELAAQKARGVRGGDTTGCGDAFAGGIVASLAGQLLEGRDRLDLRESLGWGIAAGAATLFTLGGVHYESGAGERRRIVAGFHRDWLRQFGAD